MRLLTRYRRLILLLLLPACQARLNAQVSISYDSAKTILQKIAGNYETDTLQRMNVYCSLFMSDSPTVKIDSLVGDYYFKGKNILARLDNAVFLKNDRWSVGILNDTREIYLDSVQNDERINIKANPLQVTDTLYHDPGNSYQLTTVPDTGILKVNFASYPELKEALLMFDTKSAKVLFARYLIPIPAVEALPASKYYILTMQFNEPYTDENASSVFDERKYFYIDDQKKPHGTGIYKDYRISTAY